MALEFISRTRVNPRHVADVLHGARWLDYLPVFAVVEIFVSVKLCCSHSREDVSSSQAALIETLIAQAENGEHFPSFQLQHLLPV